MAELQTNYDLGILDRAIKGVGLERSRLENSILSGQLSDMPEQRNYLRQHQKQTLAQGEQTLIQSTAQNEENAKLNPLKIELAARGYMEKVGESIGSNIDPVTYRQTQEHLTEVLKPLGISPNLKSLSELNAMAMEKGTTLEEFLPVYVNDMVRTNKEKKIALLDNINLITAQTALEKAKKEKTQNDVYVDSEGTPYVLNKNNEEDKATIFNLNLKPYSKTQDTTSDLKEYKAFKEEYKTKYGKDYKGTFVDYKKLLQKPEKPEVSRKQAVDHIAKIDVLISKLKSGNIINSADIMNLPPALQGILAITNKKVDEPSRDAAIATLEQQRSYYEEFAPKNFKTTKSVTSQPMPKGNTIQDVVKNGGKAVKMKDGSIHVYNKNGDYVGIVK